MSWAGKQAGLDIYIVLYLDNVGEMKKALTIFQVLSFFTVTKLYYLINKFNLFHFEMTRMQNSSLDVHDLLKRLNWSFWGKQMHQHIYTQRIKAGGMSP